MGDPRRFRTVMGHFATGVTVVTSRGAGGGPVGLTVNAVTSVSLRPRLVLVCLDLDSVSHDAVLAAGVFAVNVLGRDGGSLAARFSRGVRERRFEGVPWREEDTGSPVLDDALAWLDCRIHAVHPGGDHSIVVGEVEGCGAGLGAALVFFRGAYHVVDP